MLFLNNFFTKNSEEIVMANKLYKVNNDGNAPSDGTDQDQIVNSIQKKSNFSFDFGLQFKRQLCGCCRKKDKSFEQLENAKKALYEETEITNIVKTLRLAQFTSKAVLKPHQALLVGWQDKYNISGGE